MVEIIHEFSQGRGWELTCQPPQEVLWAEKAVSSEVRKLVAYPLGGEVFHLVNFRSVQRGEGGVPLPVQTVARGPVRVMTRD